MFTAHSASTHKQRKKRKKIVSNSALIILCVCVSLAASALDTFSLFHSIFILSLLNVHTKINKKKEKKEIQWEENHPKSISLLVIRLRSNMRSTNEQVVQK